MAFCTLQLNFTPQSHKDEYPECYVVFVKKKKKKKKAIYTLDYQKDVTRFPILLSPII